MTSPGTHLDHAGLGRVHPEALARLQSLDARVAATVSHRELHGEPPLRKRDGGAPGARAATHVRAAQARGARSTSNWFYGDRKGLAKPYVSVKTYKWSG